MTDYISREAALEDFESCNAENPNWTPQRVKTLLLRQPAADVVEVVRCKDCKHGELYARNDGETGVYCNCSNSIFQYANEHTFTPVRDKDDFCSYGEAE
jgi:hypothetical protein